MDLIKKFTTVDQVQPGHVFKFVADTIFMAKEETYLCTQREPKTIYWRTVILSGDQWEIIDGWRALENPSEFIMDVDEPFQVIIIDDIGPSIPC